MADIAPPPVATPKSAPAAPTPAPTAPAPKATPAPAPKIEAGGADDVFAQADAAFRKQGMTPVSERDKPPGDKPPEPIAEKPPEKVPAPALADKVKPTIKEPKELRQEYERLKTEFASKETAIKDMEGRIAAAESKGKDVTVLSERLASMEKDWEKDKALIRALKQEASPEFKKQYEEPFNRLVGKAQNLVKQMTVTDPDTQMQRPATWADFVKLYQTNEITADAAAEEIFGQRGAKVAIRYYEELHRLEDQRQVALDMEKENWKKTQEEEDANAVRNRELRESVLKDAIKDIGESVPEYNDAPEDKELSELRRKGYEIFDAQVRTPKEAAIKVAHIKHRVAAFGPDQLKIQRLTKELNDAKTELEGFRNPQPGKDGKSAGGKPVANGGTEKTWEEQFKEHMANA